MKPTILTVIATLTLALSSYGAQGDAYAITLIGGPTVQLTQTGLATGQIIQTRWGHMKGDFAADLKATPQEGDNSEAGWLAALYIKLTQFEFKQRVAQAALNKQIYKVVDGRLRLNTSVSQVDRQSVMTKLGDSQGVVFAAHWMGVDIIARLKALGVPAATIAQLTKYADDTLAEANKAQ